MPLDNNTFSLNELKFKPRLSFKNVKKFYFFFCIFLVTGILLFFIVDDNRTVLMVTTGITLLFLIILVLNHIPFFIIYSIRKDGIFVKNGFLKRQIPWEEIKDIKLLNEEESASAINTYQKNLIQKSYGYDILGAFKLQRKMGKYIQYLSVPVVFHQTTVGSERNITSFGVNSHDQLVEIILKNEEGFLISPTEPERFMSVVKSYLD